MVPLSGGFTMRLKHWVAAASAVLVLNTAYISAVSTPSIFYMANVLLHLVLGVAAAAGFAFLLRKDARLRREAGWGAMVLLALSAITGLTLAWVGNVRSNRWVLWAHIALGVAGVVGLTWRLTRKPGALPPERSAGARRWARPAVSLGLIVPAAWVLWSGFGGAPGGIRNPELTPVSMEEEGGGPASPFWPSAAKTNVGGLIPSGFFLESEKCGECHRDIYEQWKSSAHHFSSFNNQFYRKSIEHMQELSGVQGSKWCAGCHDHAMFFNGRFERPAIEQIDTPEAQAGLGCVSCHSIVHVDGTMGNGNFTIEYPELHDLASSDNPLIRNLDYFLTFLEPEPHRQTFLKPFMKDSAEFCATCHKVHLDAPVNNYRWLRGFNDYDNWQASGVSGQGARSFYYPAEPRTCGGCHMPLVPSLDPGNRNGMVHSHRFPAANTALAHVNKDERQMEATLGFLRSGFISVDIFAASPAAQDTGLGMMRRSGEGPELMSTFAVGEEAQPARQVILREVGDVAAPLEKAGAVFRPGDTVRVDVVVRTRAIGHFFPAGTVDSFDVWLELKGTDANGQVVFWSGMVEDGGKGPVEPGAHFYRSFLLDGAGNPINKRNAWQARSVLYVRLIPPGAADVAHYRMKIPEHAAGPITLEANLNYRKFSHYYTQYAYAGKPVASPAPPVLAPGGDGPAELATVHHDSRPYRFDRANIPANVSGGIKDQIPDLPIVTLASARAQLALGTSGAVPVWRPVVRKEDYERWNDWGIGMLLQGDLKGAEYAFLRVTEADPGYADGWLNVARALIQEGETDQAKPFLGRALEIDSSLGRIHFFKAMAEKADGDYEAALESLEIVRRQYPRDRVVLNQIGRVRFLMRDYGGAVEALKGVLAIDSEDLQAHYTLMLAYRGLGDTEAAAREQKLFLRFKADESSQRLTARMRRQSPEDNNERQMIHEHVSVPPEAIARAPLAAHAPRELASARGRSGR